MPEYQPTSPSGFSPAPASASGPHQGRPHAPNDDSGHGEELQPTYHGLSRSQLLIYVVVLALLLLVAILATIYHKQIFDNTKAAQVSITSSQFLPQTIDVKAGSQVMWVNNDSTAHQVAADPFPKDNSIPGFNSTIDLQPHDSMSFEFDNPGTYSYHDENNPFLLKGSVVVR